MPLSCGSGDPSGEEISKGFVLLRRNVVWGLVGFDRALLALPFFSYCRVELEVLAGKAHVASCCSTEDGLVGSGLGFRVRAEESHAWGSARATLQLAQGKSQTTQILQDRFPQLQFFLYSPSKASKAGHCSFPSSVGPCLQALLSAQVHAEGCKAD